MFDLTFSLRRDPISTDNQTGACTLYQEALVASFFYMRSLHFRTLPFKVSLRAEKLQAVALTTGPLERARRETRVVVANMVILLCVVMSIIT